MRVADLDSDGIARWAELLQHSLEPYPFLDPRMLVPAAQLRPADGDMSLIFIEDETQLVAIMPFRRFALVKSPPLEGLQSENEFLDKESTWNHPLVLASRPGEAFECLFAGLKSLGLPHLVEFTLLPSGGALELAMKDAAERLKVPLLVRETHEFARAVNATPTSIGPGLEPSFQLRTTTSATRRKVARFSRGLEAELGHKLHIEERSADPTAVSRFIDLQASGWKGDPSRGGAGIRVMGYERWFDAVTDRYRKDGDLLVYALTGGTRVVYMNVMFRIGESVFGYADAYDERFSAFNPGMLGRAAAVNAALGAPGVRIFDPNLSPHYRDASRAFPDRQTRVKLLAANGGVSSHAMVRGLPAVRELRRRLTRERPSADVAE
ncbi:MAG TPA: GNAT family N-acetyltransferase [Galbitalea sp.]